MNKKSLFAFVVVFAMMAGLLSACGLFQRDNINSEQTDKKTYIKFSENNIWVNEGFTDISITDSSSALDAIGSMTKILGISDAQEELTDGGESTIGKTTYYRYYQQYKGIPVTGRSITLAADSSGKALALNSNYIPVDNLSAEPKISKEDAYNAVSAYINQNYPVMNIIDIAIGNMVFSEKSSTEVALSYRAQVNLNDSENCLSIREMYISAENGDILSDNDALTYASVKRDFKGQSSYQPIIVDYEKSTYKMVDTDRDIKGMNLVKFKFNLGAIQSWNENYEVPEESAVDAMVNLEYSYDYFNNTFNYRPGGDKVRRTILFYTEVGLVRDKTWQIVWNASYTPDENSLYDIFMFGGKLFYGYCLSRDIDAVAHEYTHSVVDSTAGFNKKPQPKAINEAYADIFGVLVEAAYNKSDPDWIINGIDRNIASPGKDFITSFSQYTDKLDCNSASTLISHTAYLMNKGMDASDGSYKASESAIKDETVLANIWYRALTMMMPDATFTSCRKAVEDAAMLLFNEGRVRKAQLDCVTQAFDLAGIEKAIPQPNEGISNNQTTAIESTGSSENEVSATINTNDNSVDTPADNKEVSGTIFYDEFPTVPAYDAVCFTNPYKTDISDTEFNSAASYYYDKNAVSEKYINDYASLMKQYDYSMAEKDYLKYYNDLLIQYGYEGELPEFSTKLFYKGKTILGIPQSIVFLTQDEKSGELTVSVIDIEVIINEFQKSFDNIINQY